MSSRYFLCVLSVLLGLASCGKKGPPLPPLVHLPVAPPEYSAKRLGSEVVLQFKIPAANTDATNPADLARVEVYAHTEPLPLPTDYLRYGTLIATIPVKRPPLPGEAGAAAPTRTPESAAKAGETAEAQRGLVEQDWVVNVSESLTEAHYQPGPLPYKEQPLTVPVVEQLETPGTVNLPPPIMRYYVVAGVNRSNRRGLFAGPLGVPLTTPPATVQGLQGSYTQDALTLSWMVPATPARGYNVYQVDPGTAETLAKAGPAKVGAPNAPANTVMLTVPTFTDSVEFGTTRCYVVRSVAVVRSIAVESDPSPPYCVTPRDTFPPAAPRQLAAVSDEKGVSLIWEQNSERDLAGYLILRGEAPGEKLAPLNSSPTRETTYRDTTVQSGRAYVYAVVALDTAAPPNVSEPSNRTTEAIR